MKLRELLRSFQSHCNKLKIIGATLLSVGEVEKLPQYLKPYTDWWWLRSPGYYQYYAAYVHDDGSTSYYGNNVGAAYGCVRPALKLANLESSDLAVGDRFEFGGQEFEVISNNLAFCVDDIGRCAFREDWKATDANDYEQSDIKKYVDEWFGKSKNENTLNEKIHKYKITIKMESYYTACVDAVDNEAAVKEAEQLFYDENFGNIENITGELYKIELV